jgi:hypothetical protein
MRTLIFAAFILLSPILAEANESYKSAREYQIKTAFIYNFSNFISWPASAFVSTDAYFKICVLGDNPFDNMLAVTIENVTAKGRRLEVVQLGKNLDRVVDCHLVYIHNEMRVHMEKIHEIIGTRSILTVGEEKNFIAQGGIIGFYMDNKKVRLAISKERLETFKLKADANLLRLSLLCKPAGCDE